MQSEALSCDIVHLSMRSLAGSRCSEDASLDASLDLALLGKFGMCMVCVMLEALRVGYFLPLFEHCPNLEPSAHLAILLFFLLVCAILEQSADMSLQIRSIFHRWIASKTDIFEQWVGKS